MEEIWKDVKGFEGVYKISNLGNLQRHSKSFGWRQLKLTNQYGGYFSVILNAEEKEKRSVRVHVLVAETFIGEIPKGYHVHHIDRNRQNNRVDNLMIIHRTEHMIESCFENPKRYEAMVDYNKRVRGKKVSQYTLSGEWIADYANPQIAGHITGVCSRNISQVARGEQKRTQAGGFVWKYTEEKGVVV